MSEPIWVSETVVRAIHARQIAEHGGQGGLRDEGLLISALHQPKQCFHYEEPTPSLPELAASYAYSITRNHPFLDGNKRVSLVVCRLFLELNGLKYVAPPEDTYRIFLQLAAGELELDALTHWLETHTS